MDYRTIVEDRIAELKATIKRLRESEDLNIRLLKESQIALQFNQKLLRIMDEKSKGIQKKHH